MKYRCYNPSYNEYHRYGGRGIVVCDEWKDSFETFYKWAINNGYKDNLTIERKDYDGNYCPENCCWIPMEQQARNTSKNKMLEFNGERKIMVEWAEEYNIKYSVLAERIQRGWSVEKALFTPVKHIPRISLSKKDEDEIRSLYKNGIPKRHIAKKYRICPKRITKIITMGGNKE